MTRVLLVWVPKKAMKNFRRSLEEGTWGYPIPQSAPLAVGDHVVFGSDTPPGPRQKPTEWVSKSVGKLWHGVITKPWYEEHTSRWTDVDEVFPYRFDFEFEPPAYEGLALEPDVHMSAAVSLGLKEAGRVDEAQVADASGLLFLGGGFFNSGNVVPIDTAPFDGDLNVPTAGWARAEQTKLRTALLGSAASAPCAICGIVLPQDLLVAAHIKRRRDCSEDERRDLANVAMLACKLGCDALYEEGYISVAADGLVVAANGTTPHELAARVGQIVGLKCTAHTSSSAAYFVWHHAERLHA